MGNQALQRLLSVQSESPHAGSDATATRRRALNFQIPARARSSVAIQTKLTANTEANTEREDRSQHDGLAGEVRSAGSETPLVGAPAIVHDVLKSPGQSLDPDARAFF